MTSIYVKERIHQREIVIGTHSDLQKQGITSYDAWFMGEEATYEALQSYRKRELIITCVSDLPLLQKKWKETWNLPSSPSSHTRTASPKKVING